jgi:peptidoglycan/xylan/chitin deacetylase (PgdA/CDA1 family)
MKKFVLAGIALGASLIAASAFAAPAGDQMALFQTKNVFHSGLRGTHTIALTFDDGPNRYTPEVLAALKAQNVKATFFIVGKMARAYPEILREVAAEGNLLGNHSSTHPFLGRKYVEHPELLIQQIKEVDDLITPLMPAGTKFYFRAPYGAWRPQHAEVLNADPVLRKYIGPIYWDAGGDNVVSSDGYVLSAADWDCWHKRWTVDVCAKGYLREIRRENGGVVLMHCIYHQSGALVEQVVPALVEEGYSFVRLDQVPAYRQYDTPPVGNPSMAIASSVGAYMGALK